MPSKQDLLDFETKCAAAFNEGKVRAPLHLSGGNEDQLIELFGRIKPHDYVFSTWRSHYHALLHGVSREQLMAKVLKGESISINVPERRFYSSAICGGCLPIALGVAWAEKRRSATEPSHLPQCKRPWEADSHVWCFVGDMAAEMGCFHEAAKYAANHDLPVTFVVEDNGKCVNASTKELWSDPKTQDRFSWDMHACDNVQWYQYELVWPHMGTGKFIHFDDEQKFSPTGGM